MTCPDLKLDDGLHVKKMQFNVEQHDGGVGMTTKSSSKQGFRSVHIPFKIDFVLDVTEKKKWTKTISQVITVAEIDLEVATLKVKAGPVLTMEVDASGELELAVMLSGAMQICLNADFTPCPEEEGHSQNVILFEEPQYSALG